MSDKGTFSDQERNIIRMALIYLKADCDPADLEDLSTDSNQLNEDINKLIDELTPASWDEDELLKINPVDPKTQQSVTVQDNNRNKNEQDQDLEEAIALSLEASQDSSVHKIVQLSLQEQEQQQLKEAISLST